MCEKQRKPEQKRSPGSSGLYHGACGYAGDHIGSQCTRKLWETNKDRVTDEPAVLPSCGPRITLTWKGQTNMERSSLLFFFFSNHDENQIPENSLNSEVPFGNKPP